MKRALVLAVLVGVGVLLFHAIGRMPPMGKPSNPDKTHTIQRYLERGEEEGGARNIVTAIILNYRGYDTAGEVTVIFSALCAVIAVLDREKTGRSRTGVDVSKIGPSLIVRTVVRFCVPVIILFAAYVILHGETSPGGGFQGGAVLGASAVVFVLAFGLPVATRRMPLKVRMPLESSAPIGFLAMGLIGMVCGVSFLTYLLPQLHGHAVHTASMLMLMVVEIGIGLGGGMILISIVFAMSREDEYELDQDSA